MRKMALTAIELAAAKLAACDHPYTRWQVMTTRDGRELCRCRDCGATCYQGEPWFIPVLVDDVRTAVNDTVAGRDR